MSALAWWLIPLGATVLAVVFVALRSRPSRPTTAADGVEGMRRMQQAMERPMPGDPDSPKASGPEDGDPA